MELRTLLAVWTLALVGACLPKEVPLETKSCPCAVGFECDPQTNRCVRPGEVTDAGGAADAGPSDAEPADAAEVSCRFDYDCSPPETICQSGVCSAACGQPDGLRCSLGQTCEPRTGRCLKAGPCSTSAECGSDGPPFIACLDGQCVAACGTRDGACPGNRQCSSTGACVAAPSCAVDADCGDPSFVCLESLCIKRCDAPGAYPCAGLSACNASSGRCEGERALAWGQECNQTYECTTGYCLPLVGDCYCTRYCGATQDCPLGFSCMQLSNAPSGIHTQECIRSASIQSNPPLTERSGSGCSAADNACQSLVCETALCVERCSRDAHCLGLGGTCRAQIIGSIVRATCTEPSGGAVDSACGAHTDCASGICDPDRGVCVAPCCANADCRSGEHCTVFEMIPTYPITYCRPLDDPGGRDLGVACDSSDQCASGLCGRRLSASSANLMCTTVCCSDADCAGLPNGPGLCLAYSGRDTADVAYKRCVEKPSG